MATLSESIRELTNNISNDCHDMRERLSLFPLKTIKSYRRYNFSSSNKMKVKGKNMSVDDIVEYIVVIYKKLIPLTKLSYWRNDIKACSQLMRKCATSGIDYSRKTYADFKKRVDKEFNIPLREITDLSKEIAKSIKNFTLTESEEMIHMARLTRQEYDGVKAEIVGRLNEDVITESEALEMLIICHKENEEFFKEDMKADMDALEKVYTSGIITEDAYNEGVDAIYDRINAVAGAEVMYEGSNELLSDVDKIKEVYDSIKKGLYMECYLEKITLDERNESIANLERYVSESATYDEFISKING